MSLDKPIFADLSKNTVKTAQLHSQRRLFAQNLYKNLCEKFEKENGKEPPKDYVCRGKHVGEKYNRAILKQVSIQLGHNRVDVVIDSYFQHSGQPD